MIVLSVYVPDNKDSNHIKQKWTKPRGEIQYRFPLLFESIAFLWKFCKLKWKKQLLLIYTEKFSAFPDPKINVF